MTAGRGGVLAARLLAVHGALAAAQVPHAFGGAIALAYWTQDPRATSDLDVNVFVDHRSPGAALDALPAAVAGRAAAVDVVRRETQVRLWWESTPVDLFFDAVPLHARAAAGARRVAFAETTIPVLGPVELVVFKAAFDRTKDWADIEAVLAADASVAAPAGAALVELVGAGDHRIDRLEAARRAAAQAAP